MRTIRCRRCGEMFEIEGPSLPPPPCPTCKKQRDEQFIIVREVIRQCPGITALQVSEVTEVPMEIILRFVDEGLIEVVPTANKEGVLDERIGLFVKKAKEKMELFRKQKGEQQEIIDALKEESQAKEKFNWHESE